MGLRALLSIDQDAPMDIADLAVEVATEMARGAGLAITIAVSRDGRIGFDAAVRPLHLVHVIGRSMALRQRGRERLPLVVTPTTHPRRGPVLQRRLQADAAWWLVHGRSAAARLVSEGIAPSSRVLPLPVLPYLGIASHEWPTRRASQRGALGVLPGGRVVVGIGPMSDRSVEVFRQAMRGFNPREVVAVWIATHAMTTNISMATDDSVRVVSEALGRPLLAAMDVLVVMGTPYAARSAAVDAAAVGIPVITSPLDAAADFVDLVAGGSFLTSARPLELTTAVARALRMAARSRALAVAPASGGHLEDLVALTSRCYADAIGRPLNATTMLLNGRST